MRPADDGVRVGAVWLHHCSNTLGGITKMKFSMDKICDSHFQSFSSTIAKEHRGKIS